MERLNSRNEIDMQRVEKFYEESKDEVSKKVSEDVSNLIKEIEFYRTHSFEEIEKELRNEMSSRLLENEVLDEEYFQIRLDEKRKLDIFYDSLTEEQLNKFLDLYYLRVLKSSLLSKRVSSIKEASESLGKKDPKVLSEDYREVGYVKIEPQDDYDETKKKIIKEDLKKFLGGWGIVYTAGVAITTAGGALLGLLNGDISMGMEIAVCIIPFLTAATIVDGSITTLLASFKDKKTLEQSKELGIYDLLKESLKSKKEFREYIEELENKIDANLPIGYVRSYL